MKNKTPREILHEHCAKNDGCLMAGQPKWIEEAMIEYSDLRISLELKKMKEEVAYAISESKKVKQDIMLIKQQLLN